MRWVRSAARLLAVSIFLSAVAYADQQVGGEYGKHVLAEVVKPKDEIAMQKSTDHRWGPPYPFTPAELWQKLFKVLQLPANDLSRERVESIFEVKLNTAGVLPDSVTRRADRDRWYMMSTKGNVDWYFTVGTVVVPKKSSFYFSWWASGDDISILPMCLDVKTIRKDLEQLGWIYIPRDIPTPHPILSHLFRKGKDVVEVGYRPGTGCMTELQIDVMTTNGI